MRLIDADAFDRALAAHEFDAALMEADDHDQPYEHIAMYYSTQSFRDVMRCQPTINAVPVVHGRWIKEADRVNHWHCSRCGLVYGLSHASFAYCPNCGARMDGGDDDANGT